MSTKRETGLLIEDCWQELHRLHKTLAELRQASADGWKFLERAAARPRVPDCLSSGINPHIWRDRAEEVRTLAELATHVRTKNAYLDIAKSYDDLAASQET